MSNPVSHASAIAYALAGYTLWSCSDTLIKLSGQSQLPLPQILCFMSLMTAVMIALIATAHGKLQNLRTKNIKLEIIRGIVATVMGWGSVTAFTLLPLVNVYVVLFLSPLLIVIFAACFMNERLAWPGILAILLGFVGVIVALNPANIDLHNGAWWGYVGLAAALSGYVTSILLTRVASRTEHPESLSFYPQILRGLFVLPFCLWQFTPMTLKQLAYLILIGVFAALGWLAMAKAIKHAPAGMVASLHYSQLLCGALFGYMIWSDIPSWHLIAGAVIIVGAGLYMAHHVRRIKPLLPVA